MKNILDGPRPPQPTPVPSRGRLLTAEEVAALFPPEMHVTARWVRDNVLGSIKLGRKRFWFEDDVWSFLRARRDGR